jgi:amino acid adenylation domain-containing protein
MTQENIITARRALMAARIARELGESSRGTICPRADPNSFPLSSVQKRLWFTEQYHPGTAVDNSRVCFRLSGHLDVQALEDALGEVLKRHEVLRARFGNVDGQPVQSIAPLMPVRLRSTDFAHRPAEVREQEALEAAAVDSERPFDLSAGALFRPALLRVAPDEHILVITIHHIVFDGWSLGILFRELAAAYKAAIDHAPAALGSLPIQYADFAVWQLESLEQEAVAKQLIYWTNRLSGAPARLELPLDRPRPNEQTFNGAHAIVEIPSLTTESFTTVARESGATLFMALYAAFRLLLSRHTGQPDILVGTPVAGRIRSQVEPLIGCFINTLVLRTPIDEEQTFFHLLRNVKEDILEALANQDLPFERLVEELQPERDLSRSALVQVNFVLQNALPGDLELNGLHISPVSLTARTARFDLSLDVFPNSGGLRCVFEYNTDLFSSGTIERLTAHFECLLRAIIARPGAKLAELEMLTGVERARMVLDWNRTEAAYPENVCLHELVEAQARRTPRAIAVEFQDQRLTYAELDERSTKLANHLRRLGVKVESLVGVCLERSVEMMVAVVGIMKAGGAYVPLDPGFPAARLAYMLEDSAAGVLVTDQDQLWRFGDYTGVVVAIEKSATAFAAESNVLQPSGVRPENLIYVIYTSGSTGKPKGVMIPHRAVVNFLQSMRKEPGLTHEDAVLAVTTLSFDIAVLELYLPLIAGGRVIIADRETVMDGRRLAAELAIRKATVMQATPATWSMLIESGWGGNQRLKALCGGEAMSRELAEGLLKRVGSLWNMYGPTETTVWSVLARVRSERGGPVPIGRPIANTTVYVLDAQGRPAPPGIAGKLYIGGKGLARGYKNRPELTAQTFIANPLTECGGERIYSTGDLARYHADGQLECLGRLDGQVKIRGHRIEMGDIESALRRHKGVREAVVAVRGDPARGNAVEDKRLVAWMLPTGGGSPSFSEIKEHAGSLLPAYMVPSAFVFLEAFPMTPNGKVDRNALPLPDPAVRTSGGETVTPQTPLEATILRIFKNLLGISRAGVTDNFFDLGGHSLLAMRLVTQIEKETGHSIPVATLFQAPTVQQLARKLQDRTYTAAWSPLVELRKGGGSDRPPLFCIHWLDAKLVTFQKIASLLRDDRPVYGLQPKGLDGRENPPRTIKELATVYLREIRAVHPHGPYHLAGSCLGGVVAFEIAQQLIAEGEQVGLLLLIDAFMPGPLEYLHHRPQFVEYADWYFGEFLLSPLAAIKRWLHESVVRFLGRHREAGFSVRSSDRLRKVNLKAGASYQPRPYPGKVTLLMCSDGPFRTYEDRRLAWSSVAEGGFEVHVVPGNHETMEKEPNIHVLGEQFQRSFDRLEATPRTLTLVRRGRPALTDDNAPAGQPVSGTRGELMLPSCCA